MPPSHQSIRLFETQQEREKPVKRVHGPKEPRKKKHSAAPFDARTRCLLPESAANRRFAFAKNIAEESLRVDGVLWAGHRSRLAEINHGSAKSKRKLDVLSKRSSSKKISSAPKPSAFDPRALRTSRTRQRECKRCKGPENETRRWSWRSARHVA